MGRGGGRKRFYPVLRGGGGAKSGGPGILPFCSPPPPLHVINDESLTPTSLWAGHLFENQGDMSLSCLFIHKSNAVRQNTLLSIQNCKLLTPHSKYKQGKENNKETIKCYN